MFFSLLDYIISLFIDHGRIETNDIQMINLDKKKVSVEISREHTQVFVELTELSVYVCVYVLCSLQITSFDQPKWKIYRIFKCFAFQCVQITLNCLNMTKHSLQNFQLVCIVVHHRYQSGSLRLNKNNDCFDMMHASKFYSAMCWFSSCRIQTKTN